MGLFSSFKKAFNPSTYLNMVKNMKIMEAAKKAMSFTGVGAAAQGFGFNDLFSKGSSQVAQADYLSDGHKLQGEVAQAAEIARATNRSDPDLRNAERALERQVCIGNGNLTNDGRPRPRGPALRLRRTVVDQHRAQALQLEEDLAEHHTIAHADR